MRRANGGKVGRTNVGSKQQKRRTKKTTANSKASDDEYYLRWNASGDYDSDDEDWWNEVVTLERKEHYNEIRKEKKAEESLYRRYKYHTRMVMEWGNSFFPQGNNADGKTHLSLRTLIGRLDILALRGIEMPPTIHLNLELASALREDFRIRYVLQRKKQEENGEITKTSRNNNSNSNTKTSAMVSPWPRSVGINKTSTNDNVDKADNDESPKNPTNNDIPKNDKQDNHKWILYQLKRLLERFGNNSYDSEKKVSDNGSVEVSGGSDNSCSLATESFPSESTEDEHCDEPSVSDPGNEDGAATTIQQSTCTSLSPVTPVQSLTHDKMQYIDKSSRSNSNSNSSLENWDKLFGDDGSRIENNENCDTDQSSKWNSTSSLDNWDKLFGDDGSRIENCDCDSQTHGLDVGLAIVEDRQIKESEHLSNSGTLKRCDHSENEKPYSHQNPRKEEMTLSSDLNKSCDMIIADNVSELLDHRNNSIRIDFQPPNNRENKSKKPLSKDEERSDVLDHMQQEINKSENDDTVSVPKYVFKSVSNEDTPKRLLDHPKQYDSVWDTSFLEIEKSSVLENAIATSAQKDCVFLPSSEPPEDWEMLLDEEEEEDEETVIEKLISTATITREEAESSTINVALSSRKLELNKIKFSQHKNNGIKSKHPNPNNRQDIPDRVFAKPKKPPYAMKENTRYDSVWEVFPEETTTTGTSGGTQLLNDNVKIAKAAIGTAIQRAQPNEHWETLYN